MKQKELVSIIVPTYNHEAFIEQALDSILAQKVSWSFEILIGDDCSSDRTPGILMAYKKKHPNRIRLFLHKEHIGASKNAFNLLTQARGKYLATLEGDDYWCDSKKLQTQIDFLEAHPEFIGCTHYFSVEDENNCPLPVNKLSWIRQKRIFTLKDYDGILMPGQPSTFVRRNIFANPEHDYSICYKAHEMIADRTLMLIYLCQGNFFCIPQKFSVYRQRRNKDATNITTQIYKKCRTHIEDDFAMLLTLERYAREEFSIPVYFSKRKYILFTDMLLLTLLHPSADNKKSLRRIFDRLPGRFLAILIIPWMLVRKAICYIKYH